SAVPDLVLWAHTFRIALPLLTRTSLFICATLIIAWCKVQMVLTRFVLIVGVQPGTAVGVRTSTEGTFGRSARRISRVTFARPRERCAFTVPSAKPRVRAASFTVCPSRPRNSKALRKEGES